MTGPGRPVADWPRGEPWAQVAETHAAVVFLAGDRACKLKKPVNLGFLDFSTPEAREAACAREVELNREFAPDVYLGALVAGGVSEYITTCASTLLRYNGADMLLRLARSRTRRSGQAAARQHSGRRFGCSEQPSREHYYSM
jgi:aminoglycoside phosphotransferase family enzyme